MAGGECLPCKKYRARYKETYEPTRISKIDFVRKLKTWEVRNHSLYNALKERGIKIKVFANQIGVTDRTVHRWIYEDAVPCEENKIAIEQILGSIDII